MVLSPIVTGCLLICCLKFYCSGTAYPLEVTSWDRHVSVRPSVCTTAACQITANKYLDRIDFSKDPCDDFYEYACGKWRATHEILDNETDISEIIYLGLETQKTGQKILQNTPKQTFPSEVKLRRLYGQCIDEGEIERQRSTPLLKILENHIGGWPILVNKWNWANFNVSTALLKGFLAGSDPFFTVTVTADVEDPTINLIQIDAPVFFADIDVLSNNITKELYTSSYQQLLLNVTALLLKDIGITLSDRLLLEDIIDLIDMQRNLSMATLNGVELGEDDMSLNKMTLDGFQQRYHFRSSLLRNMTEILRSFFSFVNLSEAVNQDTRIVVPTSEYWLALDKVFVELETQGAEGRRRTALFIGWKLIGTMLPYLAKDFRDADAEHNQRITGRKIKRSPAITERCLDAVKTAMPLTFGAMYVREVVPTNMKEQATPIFEDIQAGFGDLLDNDALTWMDNVTHINARKKLSAIINVVGYPDVFLTNTSLIDKEYEAITLQPVFMQSMLESFRNTALRQLNRLSTVNVRYDPIKDAGDVSRVNGFYNPERNTLTITAAMLQSPFFVADSPQHANYGGIGVVIGHEVIHGFDVTGANYDDQGVRRSWWTPDTRKVFNTKKTGMIAQYSEYAVDSGNVNGELTLWENMADNGGIRAAYKGYVRYLKRAANAEPVLPGLDALDPIQLFFISVGQVWCSKERIETERVSLLTNGHSPNKWRVNGALSNMAAFSKAFNCSANAKMNPKKKQIIW